METGALFRQSSGKHLWLRVIECVRVCARARLHRSLCKDMSVNHRANLMRAQARRVWCARAASKPLRTWSRARAHTQPNAVAASSRVQSRPHCVHAAAAAAAAAIDALRTEQFHPIESALGRCRQMQPGGRIVWRYLFAALPQ